MPTELYMCPKCRYKYKITRRNRRKSEHRKHMHCPMCEKVVPFKKVM